MPELDDPGVTTPPVEPVATATPVTPAEPVGSEPVQTPGEQPGSQSVPYERFSEVNSRAKAAEDRAAEAERELEELRNNPQPPAPSEDEGDIDPDVEKMLDSFAKKRGYLTQAEIDARDAQTQVKTDVAALQEQYKDSGVPFDDAAVMKYARDNGISIGSKAALDSVYLHMNREAIIEAERNKAIDSFKSNGASSAEKPGAGGAKAPQEPDPTPGIRGRVAAARAKLK